MHAPLIPDDFPLHAPAGTPSATSLLLADEGLLTPAHPTTRREEDPVAVSAWGWDRSYMPQAHTGADLDIQEKVAPAAMGFWPTPGTPSWSEGTSKPCQWTVVDSGSLLTMVMRTWSPATTRIIGPGTVPSKVQASTRGSPLTVSTSLAG